MVVQPFSVLDLWAFRREDLLLKLISTVIQFRLNQSSFDNHAGD